MTTEYRPILMNGAMVRATLDDRKLQTRRIVKPQPTEAMWDIARANLGGDTFRARPAVGIGGIGLTMERGGLNPIGFVEPNIHCPFGRPGDRLWVREAWGYHGGDEYLYQRDAVAVVYRADDRLGPLDPIPGGRWRPSIHMPRWASRITLEITGVRCERLQQISADDAEAEGVDNAMVGKAARCESFIANTDQWPRSPLVGGYRWLWESINGPGSWDANPFVWRISFRRVAP